MSKRVYFSQDLEDERADVVVRFWLSQPDAEGTGFFDAMADSTMAGPSTIRRMLDGALDNTSVTCVLIGTHTHSRRWVRYEIIESIQRRNLIIGVHVNGIPDKLKHTKPAGPNPFETLALSIADDGESIKVLQYANNAWLAFEDKPGWPLANPMPLARRGKRIQLSSLYRVYDWAAEDGPANFAKWIGIDT